VAADAPDNERDDSDDDADVGAEEGGAEQEPPAPSWFELASTTTCPACGAAGAMMLGEGVFCPTCGQVTTPRDRPS
jgi:hypothetical protein